MHAAFPKSLNRPVRPSLMSNQTSQTTYRCLFFGMPSTLAAPILGALHHPAIELAGVVTPAPRLAGKRFRIIRENLRSPASSRNSSGIWTRSESSPPRYLVKDMRDPDLIRALVALAPDLIIVACFPWLVPADVVASATIAAVNVHPALLPRHGGPDPLFWTFRAGDQIAGVSIHHLTNRYDAGTVILQAQTTLLPDESLASLDHRLAAVGAELVSVLIEGLPAIPDPARVDPSFASYEHKPGPEDLQVHPEWTVERARRFIAGVSESHGPLLYRLSGGQSLALAGLGTGADNVEIVLVNGTLRVQPAT